MYVNVNEQNRHENTLAARDKYNLCINTGIQSSYIPYIDLDGSREDFSECPTTKYREKKTCFIYV